MEVCDPAARVCTYRPLDGDADGDPPRSCGGTDCDDNRAYVHGGAVERCGDMVDEDCDGSVDESAGRTVDCALEQLCFCNDTGACFTGAADASWSGGMEVERATVRDSAHCANVDAVIVAWAACVGDTCTSCSLDDPRVTGAAHCECGAGSMTCAGSCIDVTTDHDHCGSCDHACSATENCIGSSCQPCGTRDGACCQAGSTFDTLCGPWLAFHYSPDGATCTCTPCGDLGADCCPDLSCNAGPASYCDPSRHCAM